MWLLTIWNSLWISAGGAVCLVALDWAGLELWPSPVTQNHRACHNPGRLSAEPPATLLQRAAAEEGSAVSVMTAAGIYLCRHMNRVIYTFVKVSSCHVPQMEPFVDLQHQRQLVETVSNMCVFANGVHRVWSHYCSCLSSIWFKCYKSYLLNRPVVYSTGALQWTVLSPFLFALYT